MGAVPVVQAGTIIGKMDLLRMAVVKDVFGCNVVIGTVASTISIYRDQFDPPGLQSVRDPTNMIAELIPRAFGGEAGVTPRPYRRTSSARRQDFYHRKPH